MANAIRSDGERNPIRRRTQSNQTANAIQSDGERNPIRRRTESNQTANAISGGAAVSAAPTKQTYPPTDGTDQHRSLVGGYGILPYPRTHIIEITSHRWHGSTQMFRGCSSLCCTNKANCILPQNARNAQKSCRRVWHPAIPTHPHS